jgi:uncharacterized protein YjlB
VTVPAGVAPQLLEDNGGFQMVGSEPIGCDWDMSFSRKSDLNEENKVKAINMLEWFTRDPN